MSDVVCRIHLENGSFGDVWGGTIKFQSPEHVNANNWKCYADSNQIICKKWIIDEEENWHWFKLIMQPRAVKFLHETQNGEKLVRWYKNEVWPLSGWIYMYPDDVRIEQNRAFFRDEEMEDFLKAHGLEAVRYKEPNRKYELVSYRKDKEFKEQKLYTDGKVIFIKRDISTISRNENDYEFREFCLVTNATWVIRETFGDKGMYRKLFSFKKPFDLQDLPFFLEQ